MSEWITTVEAKRYAPIGTSTQTIRRMIVRFKVESYNLSGCRKLKDEDAQRIGAWLYEKKKRNKNKNLR